MNLENIWKYSLIFIWTGRNWRFQPWQHSKISKSLSDLAKTWNCSLRPTLRNPNIDELGKVNCIKILFSITSNFINLLINWEVCFSDNIWNKNTSSVSFHSAMILWRTRRYISLDFNTFGVSRNELGHSLICWWLILFIRVN